MTIPVIFEDTTLVVVDKPSGVVVNRSDTTAKVATLQDWVCQRYHLPAASSDPHEEEFINRSGVVHRLDKDTSGILVIAKTFQSFESLKNQFKSREVVKKYYALVHGSVSPSVGSINAPVERSPFNRTHFGVFPGGREAATDYRVIRRYSLRDDQYSYLELAPKTGRTHQIRVHLKYIGHPIVSDPLYAGRKTYRSDQKFCPRLFLHAFYLKVNHPVTSDALEFSSPLPLDLDNCLKLLK